MIERDERELLEFEFDKITDNGDLVLFDNVQFIYELSLAQLELKSLGAEFKITDGLREFKILNKTKEIISLIKRKASYIQSIKNQFTDYYYINQKNQTRSVNQYLTHWIYPYKGKFHPQMIRALLHIIKVKEGDLVFEPFSGSGTTAIEAQLLGINFRGIDVSPLCVIQGKVKTESIFVLDEIIDVKNEILLNLKPNLFDNGDNFYCFLDKLNLDEKVKNFYILARLIAISDNSRRNRDFTNSFVKNIDLMIASVSDYIEVKEKLNLKLGNIKIEIGDARNVNLPDNSVDGIITSPPYSIALDYVENDEHALIDLGYDTTKIRNDFIGVRGNGSNRIDLYNNDMKLSYNEMYRILKPNKYIALIIGNATYQAREVKTVEFTIDYLQNIGFKLIHNINKIIFGLYNVMKKENILVFQKVY